MSRKPTKKTAVTPLQLDYESQKHVKINPNSEVLKGSRWNVLEMANAAPSNLMLAAERKNTALQNANNFLQSVASGMKKIPDEDDAVLNDVNCDLSQFLVPTSLQTALILSGQKRIFDDFAKSKLSIQQKKVLQSVLDLKKDITEIKKNFDKEFCCLLFDSGHVSKGVLELSFANTEERTENLLDAFATNVDPQAPLPIGSQCVLCPDYVEKLCKFSPKCTMHETCVKNREKHCKCTATICLPCLYKHLSETYAIGKGAICIQCNAPFCFQDVMIYKVAQPEITEDDGKKQKSLKWTVDGTFIEQCLIDEKVWDSQRLCAFGREFFLRFCGDESDFSLVLFETERSVEKSKNRHFYAMVSITIHNEDDVLTKNAHHVDKHDWNGEKKFLIALFKFSEPFGAKFSKSNGFLTRHSELKIQVVMIRPSPTKENDKVDATLESIRERLEEQESDMKNIVQVKPFSYEEPVTLPSASNAATNPLQTAATSSTETSSTATADTSMKKRKHDGSEVEGVADTGKRAK